MAVRVSNTEEQFIQPIKLEIPGNLLAAPISWLAKNICMDLCSRVNRKNPMVLIDSEELAEKYKKSIATIRKAVKELIEHGFIRFAEMIVNKTKKVFEVVWAAAKKVAEVVAAKMDPGLRQDDRKEMDDKKNSTPETYDESSLTAADLKYAKEVSEREKAQLEAEAREEANKKFFAKLAEKCKPQAWNDGSPPKERINFSEGRVEIHEASLNILREIAELMLAYGFDDDIACEVMQKHGYRSLQAKINGFKMLESYGHGVENPGMTLLEELYHIEKKQVVTTA